MMEQILKPPVPAILIASLLGLITPTLGRYSKERFGTDVSPHIAIAALLAMLVYSTAGVAGLLPGGAIPTLSVDKLGYLFTVVFSTVGLLIAIASFERVSGKVNSEAFYSLLVLSVVGMTVVGFSRDVLLIFVAVTMFSVPTYALVALRKTPLASEAAMKYFVVSTLSTGLLIYALSIIYGITGTTDIPQILTRLSFMGQSARDMLSVGFIFLLAGLGFEMAIVPFHLWIPDAYDGAPPMVAALLAAAGKIAGFAAFIRLAAYLAPAFSALNWTQIMAFLALITMTWGNVAALMQKRFTRMLAYSSIAHAGYVLVGLTFVADPRLSIFALAASLYHLFNYAIMKSGSFLAAFAVEEGLNSVEVTAYNGLGRRMPLTAFSLTMLLLALAGIPPLNGFWSKVFLFWAAISGEMAWLAVAMAVNSAFSVGYYGWIIKRMYVDRPEAPSKGVKEPMAPLIAILILAALTVIVGIFYPQFYDLMVKAARSLYTTSS